MIYRGWIVLAALSIMMCIGVALPIFGGSVVNTYMVDALGWSRQSLGLLVSISMITTALLSPVAAMAVSKLGVRTCLCSGCLCMVAGSVALATVVARPWQGILAFSIVIGITGAFSGTLVCQTGVAAWFVRRRTFALSVLFTAAGVGGFLIVGLINGAIALTGDWRAGWWVFAGAGLLGTVIGLVFVRGTPQAGHDELLPPDTADAASTAEHTLGQAIRSPLLWALLLTMFTMNAGTSFLFAHTQVYLRGLGFTPTLAAAAMSLMSVGMVIGNIGFGALAPVVGLRRTYVAALIVFGASLLLLANVQGTLALLAFALAAGTGFGGGQVGSMSMLGHYWGTRVFPALIAIGMLIQNIGAGLSPVLAGAYFDAHQSYLAAIYFIMAINIGAAPLLLAGFQLQKKLSEVPA